MLQGKTITISNAMSLVRVALLVPIFQMLARNTPSGNGWALFFMGLAVLTDFLDGFLARQWKQVSDLGRVLDPVADKICIVAVSWFLTSPARLHPLPAWLLLVIMVRDVAIVAGSYLIYRRGGYVVGSNIWGKITSTILAFLLIVYVLDLESLRVSPVWVPVSLGQLLVWLALTFLVISTFFYGRRLVLYLKQHKKVVYRAGLWGTNGGGSQAQQNPGKP